MAVLGQKSVTLSKATIEPGLSFSIHCQTQGNNQSTKLIAYINDQQVANKLSRLLCSNSVVAKQYGAVDVYWSTGEDQVLQFTGKGIADLALVKKNLMDAVKAETTYGYEEVGSYPDYTAYLISLREKPVISKEYLLGKRIGLVDYPTSRSGHIIPIRMMKSLGLSPNNLHIQFASNHAELRELLTSGQVDLISTYWQETDQDTLFKNYITPIDEQIKGSTWYLKMDTDNVDLYCAIQQVLATIAKQTQSSYFKQLTLTGNCDENLNTAN
ncbi:PhnD/SsuA/transferrin family substrate-binding protein [Neptunicella marina]|uniref:PhnD/SsuA/transferrin family substrate-binding protein n=2 Tax=Neptunicella marina TaxID=2125989 RepID=A0A8J6LYI1_9ALTE|nr:PhnD/SsuA/transferrin family substrate-binding protein [Neptunicella marina]